jgi:uncharacterized membrane protein YkoI
MKKSVLTWAIATVTCFGSFSAWSEEKATDIAKMMPQAKVTLAQGLTTSESQGKPISGKFEVDEGHFQLSVYTAKSGKFSEVVIDPATGAVTKTEAITEGDDLAEAKAQNAASSKATKSLKAAAQQAEKESPGFHAVSIAAKLDNGRAVADVDLVKGTVHKAATTSLE